MSFHFHFSRSLNDTDIPSRSLVLYEICREIWRAQCAHFANAYRACLRDSVQHDRETPIFSSPNLIFPDRVKLLLCRLRVGVVAAFDIIVLRGQTQIVLRRSGRCPLLVARRDGRFNSVETGLQIHSKQLVLMAPRAWSRANYSAGSFVSFCYFFHISLVILRDYSYLSQIQIYLTEPRP